MCWRHVRVCVLSALSVSALGSLSGCASLSEAQVSYNACTASYNQNRQSLNGSWAFVSGVNGQGGQCFWRYGEPNSQTAWQGAMSNCKQKYSSCFVYATSDGVAAWAKEISDNGGTVKTAQQNHPISTKCKLGLFKAGMQLGIDIFAAARGQSAPYDGSDVNPDDCKQ